MVEFEQLRVRLSMSTAQRVQTTYKSVGRYMRLNMHQNGNKLTGGVSRLRKILKARANPSMHNRSYLLAGIAIT
jgi:hypothetical protein